MAQSEWGSPGPIEVYADSQFDPMQGWEQELHYRGYPLDLVALGNAFIAAGWRARTESTNSQWAKLIVSIPNNSNEDFIDRYEFNIDFKQQGIWTNLNIHAYLIASGLTDSMILDLKTKLVAAINANPPMTLSQVDTKYGMTYGSAAGDIYQMYLLDQDSVEVAQPTISRKRTYDIAFAGSIMRTRNTQDFYPTSELISTFGIPAVVAAQITADPEAVPMYNYGYGWKMRKNNLVIIPAKNKIEEQIDWVWDQWSNIAYNYIA